MPVPLNPGGGKIGQQLLLLGPADDPGCPDHGSEPMVPGRAWCSRQLRGVKRDAPQRIEEAFLTILTAAYPPEIECRQKGCRQRQEDDAGLWRDEMHLTDMDG